jgi:threonine dehydrogenase-like Zn-dependent dehydrogenase
MTRRPARTPLYTAHVRAVRSIGDGRVGVVEVDLPSGDNVPDPVRLRVRSVGICGSDLHLLNWNLPVTLGHEFAGVLDDGTSVAVQPSVPCGSCDQCAIGATNRCRTGLTRLYGVSLDGGLADEVVVDRSCLVGLAPGVAPERAALVEPLAVALHALNHAGVVGPGAVGQKVLVIGGGSIGLGVVAVARHRGVDVDLIARHATQRAAGEILGAGQELTDEYDVVVDAAGTQSSLDQATSYLRPGGTLAIVSTYWDPVQIGTDQLMKEARLVPGSMYGIFHGAREFDDAAAVLAAHPEIEQALVSHRFGLDDAPEAFRVAADRSAGAIKVLLHP